MRSLLATVGVPAFVDGSAFDVLASNRLARALTPRLRPGENRLRSLLLDPGERDFHADREAATEEFAGSFRRSARTPATRASSNSSGSCRCQRTVHGLWARHDVRRLAGGTATVHHPVVGELRLHRDKLPVDRLTLVLHYADGGSESAEKLRALASPATETGDGEESIERPPAREAGDSRESRWGP
nr:hypothetical protein [Geodermatophilus normandii]